MKSLPSCFFFFFFGFKPANSCRRFKLLGRTRFFRKIRDWRLHKSKSFCFLCSTMKLCDSILPKSLALVYFKWPIFRHFFHPLLSASACFCNWYKYFLIVFLGGKKTTLSNHAETWNYFYLVPFYSCAYNIFEVYKCWVMYVYNIHNYVLNCGMLSSHQPLL